jgi:hypothetical protein
MSRFLNDEEASTARQQLIDAGYTENGADSALKEHQDKYRSTTDSLTQYIDNASAIKLGVEGLGAGLGVYGGIKVGKGIYDRMFRPPEASLGSSKPIEPMMDVSQRPVGRQEPRMVGDLFPADVSTKPMAQPTVTAPTLAPIPETPTVPLTTEVGKAPKEMPMIEQAAGTPEKKAVAEGRKKAAIVPPPAQPSLMTGSGMPAYQGTGPKGAKLSTNIPSLANLPEDKVFVPGGQYMDIIRNATGQEAYTENLKKYGYPVTPQQGYETGRKINESLGRLTREEAKATGAALGEPTKAITEKVNKIKMVKVGGVAGALISLTDLAKADTLRQGLGNVAEGLMPIGIAPSELASGKLTEKQLNAYKEAQKLGSPYRSVPPPR